MDNINKSNFKLSYEELLEQNTQLKNELHKVQGITKIGTWQLDIATNQVEWSEELYKMYGFDPKLPVPPYTEHMKLFTKESWDLLSSSLAKTAETGTPYELVLNTVKKDGNNGWMWVRGETVTDAEGKIIGLWGAAQDISKQKENEEKLLKNEQLLNETGRLAKIGGWELDVVTMTPYYTQETMRIYGISLDAEVPNGIEGIKYYPEEAQRKLKKLVQDAIEKGTPYDIELPFVNKQGKHLWVRTIGIPEKKDGKVSRLYGTFQDITEKKKLEEELINAKLKAEDSEVQLKYSQKVARIGYYIFNVQTDLWTSSEMLDEIFGINKNYNRDVQGWLNLIHPDFQQEMLNYLSVNIQKNHETFNKSYQITNIKTGLPCWVHGLGTLEFDDNDNLLKMFGTIQDISDSKKFEQEIIEAKEKAEESAKILKTTLQTAMDGYWVVDIKGRFINVNDTYCRMSGYNREDLLSMYISDIEAIQSPEEINENIQRIKQLGQLRFETKHVRKDGTLYDVEMGIQYQESNDGQFVCFIKDITEQKKHEAEIILAKEVAEQSKSKIALNEKRLNALVELNQMTDKSDDFIYDFTLNKAIELTQSKIGFLGFVNDDESEVDIYKWSDSAMKECAVRNINMNFIVDEAGIWGDVIRLREALILNDYSQAIPNKKEIPVGHVNIKNYLSIPTFQQNKIVAIISVSNKEDDYVQSDINQIKLLLDGMRRFLDQRKEKEALINARQKAEESQMQLELITDNFVNGMIYQVAMLDENRRQFNYISNNVKKLYDCTVKEAKEDANLIYGKLHPDDVMGLIEKEKVALKNMSVFETESRVITPNGNIRWAYYISKPRIINGIVCWDGIEVDITERKQMELELINAKEKAEESERLKSAFLANMSHEIRTPMNGILGFTSLLKDANLSVENQKNYIDIIEKSGNRLLNTVNDIIEISKIESGEISVIKSEVIIVGHLDTLVTFFRPEAKKKNIEIVMQNNIEGNDLAITIDKNKLNSILSNLIKNAIKYTNEGTIKVGIKVKNNQVLFSCQDTGIGIPKNRQKAIFNRFEQADILDKQVHEGSGLGLAIVKSYVEMLDGKIWVESEVGKGSVFYVSLPYNPAKRMEDDLILTEQFSDGVKKNINVLIVEDDENSLMHLSIITKEITENIATAGNGIEAVEFCKNDSSIDLVLMDMKMPKMNGFEATKKIREFNKDVVIIAQTAFAFEKEKQNALDAGCDDFITKPIVKDKLLQIINKYFLL